MNISFMRMVPWRNRLASICNEDLPRLVAQIAQDELTAQDEFGNTLLHLLCRRRGEKATQVAKSLLLSGSFDVNHADSWMQTPAHQTAAWDSADILQLLCAAGANMRALDRLGYTPMCHALRNSSHACCRVLSANGVRLSSTPQHCGFVTNALREFECGVLRCRAAAVAMMHVKSAGRLWRWDKFLLREVALAIWTTRYEEKWALTE